MFTIEKQVLKRQFFEEAGKSNQSSGAWQEIASRLHGISIYELHLNIHLHHTLVFQLSPLLVYTSTL